jgi:hypothetical protein
MTRPLLLCLALATSTVAFSPTFSHAGSPATKAAVNRVAVRRAKAPVRAKAAKPSLWHRIKNGKLTLVSWKGRALLSVGIRPEGTSNGEVVVGVSARHSAKWGATVGLLKAKGTGGLNIAPWVDSKGNGQLSLGLVSRTKGDRVLNLSPVALGEGGHNLQVGLFSRIKNRTGKRSLALGAATVGRGKGAVTAGLAYTRSSDRAVGVGAIANASRRGHSVGVVGTSSANGTTTAAANFTRKGGTGQGLVGVPLGGRTRSLVDFPVFQGRKNQGERATKSAANPTVLAIMPKASRSLIEVNAFQTRVPLRSTRK